MNILKGVRLALALFMVYLWLACCFLDEQGSDYNDSYIGISEFVSNDTLRYIASYSPFILDGFKDINLYSQMRSIYYDINDFEEVSDKDFIRMADEKGEYKFITLENKMKAFLVSKPILYKSSIAIMIRYGALNEPFSMKGLSVLLKNLIISKVKFKINRRANPLYFKNLENTIDGRVSDHATEISIEVFNEDFVDTLHTISEVLTGPLDADFHALSSLRKATREEIKARCVSMESLKSVIAGSYFCKKSGYKYLDAFADSNANTKGEFKRGYRITANSKMADELSDKYSDLDRILNDHFNKYYCGNLMTLAVVSNEDMHYLQTLVKAFFGRIRSSNVSVRELGRAYNFTENPYLKHVGSVITIQQSSVNLELKLIFPIPYQKNLWRYKLTEYISFYLDDESEEGLVGVLRSRGWISSISSGCETDDSGYSNFIVLITLQKEGVRHILQILEALLSTIKLISKQGFSEETLSHIREESSFELKSLYLDLDTNNAGFILRSFLGTGCFPKDVLVAPFVMDQVEGRYIQKLLTFIRADNMVISHPVKSLVNGASFYLRLSDSFLNSYLFAFERTIFKFFHSTSNFFLKLFGVTSVRVAYKFSKKLYYSQEKVPQYLQNRLSFISASVAQEQLKIQLFDPSLESYNQMYVNAQSKPIRSPISLDKALSDRLFNYNIEFGKPRADETNYSQDVETEPEEKKMLMDFNSKFYDSLMGSDDDLIGFGHGNLSQEFFDADLSGEFGGEYATYVQGLRRDPLEFDGTRGIERGYLQSGLESIFYMPLQNQLPALSIVFDITIPLELNNSTDLLLLNMNKHKLILLSFLFKHSISQFMTNSNSDGMIKVENYTDFMNINVLPGIRISWDGNTKHFDDFFLMLIYNLVHYRIILTESYFERSMTELRKLLERLNNASNEDYSLMQLLQIMHLESVKSWALENDAKHLSLDDLRLFGKILLRYGQVHGVAIGNCTPIQIYTRIDRLIRLIRPSSRMFNSVDHVSSGKVSMVFGTQRDGWTSDRDLTDELIRRNYLGPISRSTENKGNAFGSKFINMDLLPSTFRRNYFFKRRVSSSDPFNTVLLYVYLGSASEEIRVLLDLLELVDFQKALNSFIANKKSLRYSSIQIGSLFITPDIASFQIRVTFLSNKVSSMVKIILEFFDIYFLNPEKVFSEKDFLSLKNMLLSNFQKHSLNPAKLAQIHYERIICANLAPDWQIREIETLNDLCFRRFLNLWDSFRTAPTILIAIQSNRNQNEHHAQLSEFVPDGYTKLMSIYQFKDSFS
ncbi:signal peptide-containing secreted insulinase-like peptidase [Cryptosporidium canis]|uniref:Signal peptide-containing secreted insulinase-like peptidase n=1 Tax=Cryptosporidium canis TaxID=195482 RepID=A0A9D5DE75_9CRYT|nr:signal peptide-containing secreted insulinase-like peptidase [Cryptosporidium canis]